jgi:hypothetical protein
MSDATGKGLGSKLFGMMFETSPDVTPNSAQPQPTAPAGVFSTSFNKTFTPITSGAPSVDPEIMQFLQAKIGARRTPFTSLLESSEKLRAIIPDDITRLKAAAATTAGDKAAILQAIDIHINDLDTEALNFQRFQDGEAKSKVEAFNTSGDGALQDAAEADKRIGELTQEIQHLQQRAADQRSASAQAKQSAAAEQAELDRKSAAFTLALNAAKSSLLQQKNVLNATL